MRGDGSRFWACWVTTPVHDPSGKLRGFAKVLRDETERKQTEDLLTKSLEEKELLLREIHHGVKNNLHVINALLSLQAGQVNDSELRVILEELQDRVRAIAALHQRPVRLPGSREYRFRPIYAPTCARPDCLSRNRPATDRSSHRSRRHSSFD